ncbi:NADH dehydrogenase [ubiquinone] 1 alpha subcomplex subunit 5-like [Oppia nitens]|uniref:NADH dehydrogenase [ubiquinone] 1 alpha subcomplex subunit 5-like n=1 Tax=Oppia nitens TaxID=1686743 RepID=UPI0023DA334D|nr:NADH dehydrogenase [ubiquinone] 1 alpha subcomplex subunit 5-like [Oppia nitens]
MIAMSGAIKKTTGLTGLLVARNAHYSLTRLYNKILKTLAKMPDESAYKKYTTETVNERLAIVMKEKDVKAIEDKINCGQIEEVIVQAENELALSKRIAETRAWEPLITKPPINQWKWPHV